MGCGVNKLIFGITGTEEPLYLGIVQGLLRYFTPDGDLVPTPEESAEFEAQRAAIEAQRATMFDEKAQRLAAKLRELNIDPDTI